MEMQAWQLYFKNSKQKSPGMLVLDQSCWKTRVAVTWMNIYPWGRGELVLCLTVLVKMELLFVRIVVLLGESGVLVYN